MVDRRHEDGDRRHRSSRIVLVRNHEGDAGPVYVSGRPDITCATPGSPTGNGGTTNLVFDTRRGEWLSAWSSLAGTVRNCAGGVTPWGTWLTCEETRLRVMAGLSTSAIARATRRRSSIWAASLTEP